MLLWNADVDVDVDVGVADVISCVPCNVLCVLSAWPRIGMQPAIRTPLCGGNPEMRIEHRQGQTPGLGGPAWKIASGTWPIKTATANREHWGVCLFAQIPSKGPHCGFAMRNAAHGACVHMHMAQADQAESLWQIKPIAIAENVTTQRHSL